MLLAEDNDNLRELSADFLAANGYEVTVCEDGLLAWEALQENRCDLILLDVMMPNMDGFEFCKKIREIESVPIIFLTAKVAEEDQLNGFRIGADDYIIKPFSLPVLLAKVKVILERILSDFSAQNVAFLFLYRTKTDNTITATAHNALKAVSYIHKLETISMPIFYKGHYEAPAVYAHEMLHLFGAQDLYCKTALITQEYADYQNKNKTNDIMRIQTDLKTGQYNLKEITNTFSRVDAYYTYLTDRCDEVEKWGLEKRVER